ncbi:hypothetical protein FA15DRAFT_245889, partial [Coprinopsis marcescibilis]
MSSFFNKVLRRNKRDDREASASSESHHRESELLGGKFEDVSPSVSPSAAKFPDDQQRGRDLEKSKDKPALRTFFRSKSRSARSPARTTRRIDDLPQLSLALLNGGGLGVEQPVLSDVAIAQKRLTPVEALGLVRSCSKVITTRGVDALGIMNPHWYSASPEIQRKLISLFIHSLTAQSPVSSTSFDAEINSTRSPHDVAAVLRWALRHIQLEEDSFGHTDAWYTAFFQGERSTGYPADAFSKTLVPLLPTPHAEFLKEVLDVFTSLASHAESNSTSGSKLAKMFGLWILNSHRVESKADWKAFYARWEVTGRQLEHIFFAYIRDEASANRMPKRLLELVKKYPYQDGPSPTTDLKLLPRPQFTTRRYHALFVRVETELPSESLRPKSRTHPLRVVAEALAAGPASNDGHAAALWGRILEASKTKDSGSPLSRIFADETIRFLTLTPPSPDGGDDDEAIKSPTLALFTPSSPRRPAFSLGEFREQLEKMQTQMQRSDSGQSTETETQLGTAVSPASASSGDWSLFSSAGFSAVTPLTPLAPTLFGTSEVERTAPPLPLPGGVSRSVSGHKRQSSRKSVEFRMEGDVSRKGSEAGVGAKQPLLDASKESAEGVQQLVSAVALVQVVQLDEAFVDFWADALADPGSSWPSFAVCKLKESLVGQLRAVEDAPGSTAAETKELVRWVVLEQAFTVRPPPAPVPSASASGSADGHAD